MGGTELYLDTRFNPDDLQIQYGEIVSVPLKWDLGARPGDTLFFHHHVTTNESLHLEGDEYMVIYDLGLNGLNNQAIAYRSKETGELHALGEWVLTEPVDNPKAQETTTSFGIILPRQTLSQSTGQTSAVSWQPTQSSKRWVLLPGTSSTLTTTRITNLSSRTAVMSSVCEHET